MEHEFVILENGKIKTYTRYEDIPLKFDAMIKFNPYMPPPPHSEEEHEEIDSWVPRFQELLKRGTF
jgi:hypothetical protein